MNENKILAIIQARMGSTRLPEKVLMKLEDRTVLEHVVDRVGKSTYVTDLFVATTIDQKDLAIVRLCAEKNIRVFCGSEHDVLDRFFQLAKLIKPDHIVRITADCPLMDPAVLDLVISRHLETEADYTTNTFGETYPDGQDVEVFTYHAIQKAWKEADLVSEREHVTPYIRKHAEIFKHTSVDYSENLSGKRWTLDNAEDYEFIKRVYKALYGKDKIFGMEQVLSFLRQNPQIESINNAISRNEGYKKSLMQDKRVVER